MKKKENLDFYAHKFYSYSGPNFYLDKRAMVFNLFIDEEGQDVEFYKNQVIEKLPHLEENYPSSVVDLFADILSAVFKMDMNLFVGKYAITKDGEEWTIAIEDLDKNLSKDCILFVSDWFIAMNKSDETFDFDKEFENLQEVFNKTIYGGPTIYSLVEGGIKKNIPVHFLYEENQFQWGYGKKQRRGRSTIFHTDGIKDTEFTSYKDMVGDFLEMCGFPTPKGKNCFEEEEILEEAKILGFPVVVKPVAGHKGQGVTTGIESIEEVKKAFNNIKKAEGVAFEGALVQQQIYGYDHRILTVGGKHAATLKRIPAYVIGDGANTIEELIAIENSKEVRLDNARSPLAKIHLDEDMTDFLKLQGLTKDAVPEKDEEIILRRVANISAGGVSINVTDEIHPENIKMVENIARFFHVTTMGIDVLAKDISKPWTDGDFGIIEINAGPGVFMHLAPAEGGTVDIPEKIMNHFFKNGRIPIIAGNNISDDLFNKIENKLKEYKEDLEVGSLRKDGVYFNGSFFTKNKYHDTNSSILLRNPKLDIAIFNHTSDNIYDDGIWHEGLDLAILNKANCGEEILKRDILKNGYLLEITERKLEDNEIIEKTEAEKISIKNIKDKKVLKIISSLQGEIERLKKQVKEIRKQNGNFVNELILSKNGEILSKKIVLEDENIDDLILENIKIYLKEILFKYE